VKIQGEIRRKAKSKKKKLQRGKAIIKREREKGLQGAEDVMELGERCVPYD